MSRPRYGWPSFSRPPHPYSIPTSHFLFVRASIVPAVDTIDEVRIVDQDQSSPMLSRVERIFAADQREYGPLDTPGLVIPLS